MENIGEKLYDARKRCGLTQAELAERINVTPKSISAIERGTHLPKLTTLIQLCAELGVELRVVNTEDRPIPHQLAEIVAQLTEIEIELLTSIAHSVHDIFHKGEE